MSNMLSSRTTAQLSWRPVYLVELYSLISHNNKVSSAKPKSYNQAGLKSEAQGEQSLPLGSKGVPLHFPAFDAMFSYMTMFLALQHLLSSLSFVRRLHRDESGTPWFLIRVTRWDTRPVCAKRRM